MTGGGTAGHVLPALAIADALVARGHDRRSIHYAGSERGIETRLVPPSGFEMTLLPGRGIQRRLTLANLAAVGGLLVAFFRALVLVGRLRPKVVVAVGGYASVAVALAARPVARARAGGRAERRARARPTGSSPGSPGPPPSASRARRCAGPSSPATRCGPRSPRSATATAGPRRAPRWASTRGAGWCW